MNENLTVGYLQMAHLYFTSKVLKQIICVATQFKYKLITTKPLLGFTLLQWTSSEKKCVPTMSWCHDHTLVVEDIPLKVKVKFTL